MTPLRIRSSGSSRPATRDEPECRGPAQNSPVPEVSRFYGIVVTIHYGDHNPPHFHATYQGAKVEIDIRTLAVLDGGIPPRALGLVMEWAAAHQPELAADWRLAADGREPLKIAPLA